MKLKLFTKTFTRNEFRTILGKRMSNFWILLVVFLCSIGALEFSRAGMRYLEFKMSDPFINWVEIQEQGDNFKYFRAAINPQDTLGPASTFMIGDVEENVVESKYLCGAEGSEPRVDYRTIKSDSRLLERILEEDNVVVKRSTPITENDYGWIVTRSLMEQRLKYKDTSEYPLMLNLQMLANRDTLAEWGLKGMGEDSNWTIAHLPIIAVVEQLPSLLDVMAPTFFFKQLNASPNPFLCTEWRKYFDVDPLYFIIDDTTGVAEKINYFLDKDSISHDEFITVEDFDMSYRRAYRLRVVLYDSVIAPRNHAAQMIVDSIPGIYRNFDYNFGSGIQNENVNYVSIMFSNLDSISNFAQWAYEQYGIRIDMAQIEAKENFKTFNILASVLCVAIMILSVLFVTIFLWFLIDSHFRAISKNLGTIMAFGLLNRTIIHIYLRVFLRMVLCSLVIAVVLLGVTELVLSLVGVERAGGMHYIILNDAWVWALIVIIPLLTTVVVTLTMRGKLKAKPGDLIFERNN